MKRVFLKGKICDAPGCIKPAKRRMLCTLHYQRWCKHGTLERITHRNYGIGNSYAERFWSRVALTANPEKCWNWLAGTEGYGYGRLTKEGKHILAHHAAFELVNGYSPDALLLHKCDNPVCVNPDHLFLGTHADNSNDKVAKDRQAKGSGHGKAKLTEADIPQVRIMLAEGIPPARIGKQFNVCRTTIRAVAEGKTWTHVN